MLIFLLIILLLAFVLMLALSIYDYVRQGLLCSPEAQRKYVDRENQRANQLENTKKEDEGQSLLSPEAPADKPLH